ncbi:MAG: restriction endonuclease [Agriterribacter sp.]
MSVYQIIEKEPIDWKELQQYTSIVLSDCGFNAMIEKTIHTVRGAVEVDVYAEKQGAYKTKILCECKYWNSSIPQTIIHAFRTIVEDSGANQGIIISKAGFQKGAYEAARNANIVLFSWQEFQAAFKMEYLHFVIDRNYKKGYELRMKANAILELHDKHPLILSDEEFNEFQLLRDAYSDLLLYSFRESYEHLETKEIIIPEVEREIRSGIMDLRIVPNSLKEYFDYIFYKCQAEIEKIQSIQMVISKRLS